MSQTELVGAVSALARAEGANPCAWPRLTAYRFDTPQEPAFEQVESLSFCCVVAGRKSVRIADRSWDYDPLNYLVLTREVVFAAEILQASPERPFLSLILQIDPGLVRRIASDMSERALTPLRRPTTTGGDPTRPAFVSGFDGEIAGALLRFLRASSTAADRRVLAPLYLHEIVYRLLQADQRDRLLDAATAATDTDPVALAARYILENLGSPLTVAAIAERAGMSPSTFAHLFKELTGTAPYQFVQQARLDRARGMLATLDVGVGEVARTVGYASLSHFSNEFRRRFGISPRGYARSFERPERAARPGQA